MYAQICIHISITKSAYNYEESLYYNTIISFYQAQGHRFWGQRGGGVECPQ